MNTIYENTTENLSLNDFKIDIFVTKKIICLKYFKILIFEDLYTWSIFNNVKTQVGIAMFYIFVVLKLSRGGGCQSSSRQS